MRKIIAILLCLFSVYCFSSCKESGTSSEETSKNKIIREADSDFVNETTVIDSTTVETTELVVEESSENYVKSGYKTGNYLKAEWEIEPITIYNDKSILVNVEEMVVDSSGEVAGVIIYVGNDSNESIELNIKHFYVNNLLWFMDSNDFLTIEAGDDGYGVLGFDMHELGLYNVKDIGSISIEIEGKNPYKSTVFNTGMIDIKTTAYDKMEEPNMTLGKVLGDNEQIKCVAHCYVDDNQYCLSIFAINRTEQEIIVEGQDLVINGKNYGNIIRLVVPAGKCQHISFDLMTHPNVKADYGSTGLSDVTFAMGYKYIPVGDCEWVSDRTTLEFK